MRNVYLIGFMGAGKSHTGRLLADRLGWPLLDLDAAVETAAGQTVAAIFATLGEAEFRRRETRALRETVARGPLVVSTGGGAPCFHGNMEWLLDHGHVVFLDPPTEVLEARLAAGRAHRPLLAAPDWRTALRRRLAARRPVYERAHLRLEDTDDLEALLGFLREEE